MATKTVCDNPTCENTKQPERRLCEEPWLEVRSPSINPFTNSEQLDFCSRRCVAEWAVGHPIPTSTVEATR